MLEKKSKEGGRKIREERTQGVLRIEKSTIYGRQGRQDYTGNGGVAIIGVLRAGEAIDMEERTNNGGENGKSRRALKLGRGWVDK